MPSAPDRKKLPGTARDVILQALHRGESLSYDDMVAITGCTSRQCRRAVKELREAEAPIEVRKVGRQRFFSIPEEKREIGVRVSLSEEEMQALMIAASASLPSLGPTPLAVAMRTAIDQLTAQMSGEFYTFDPEEQNQQWHFNPTPSSTLDPAIFTQIRSAIEECQTLQVRYFTAARLEESTRKLDPYALAAPAGSWQLLAWCHRNNDFRTFSLAAIRAAEETGSYFTRREIDVPSRFAPNLGGVGGEKIYDVRLSVSPDCLPSFRRKQYHRSQEVTEHEDGSATVTLRVAGLEDTRAFVLGFGDGVRVEEPEELVAIVRGEVERMMKIYGVG